MNFGGVIFIGDSRKIRHKNGRQFDAVLFLVLAPTSAVQMNYRSSRTFCINVCKINVFLLIGPFLTAFVSIMQHAVLVTWSIIYLFSRFTINLRLPYVQSL